jgi:hypothetical protein
MGSIEISSHDFTELAEAERELQLGVSSFGFPAEHGSCRATWYSRQGRVVCVSLTVPDGYKSGGDHLALVPTEGESGTCEFIYPAERIPEVHGFIEYRRSVDTVPPLPVREVAPEQRIPTAIGTVAIAELIRETDPKKILFYTGAGISGGGEAPMRDYHSLTDSCGFAAFDRLNPDACRNEMFVRAFLSDPEKAEYMMAAYQQTLDIIYRDAATPAHVALAAIARSLHPEPSFLTTNYDLKHESEGSRIRVPKIVTAWHDTQWPGFSLKHKERRNRTREMVESIRETGVDLLLAVGAAADRRGAIEWLEPKTIVAINIDPPESLPYIGEQDHYLHRDAQVAVPAIADELTGQVHRKVV